MPEEKNREWHKNYCKVINIPPKANTPSAQKSEKWYGNVIVKAQSGELADPSLAFSFS